MTDGRSFARMVFVALIFLSYGGPGRGEQKEPDVEFVPTPHEVVAEMLKPRR